MKSRLKSMVLPFAFAGGYLAVNALAGGSGGYCVVDNGTSCRVCQNCQSPTHCSAGSQNIVASANCTDPNEQPDCQLEVVDGVVSYSADCVKKNPTPIGGPGGLD